MNPARSTRIGPCSSRALTSSLIALLCLLMLSLSSASCATHGQQENPNAKAARSSTQAIARASDTTQSEDFGVTSVYSTRPLRTGAAGSKSDPEPIEIPPPDVLMITGRSNVTPPASPLLDELKATLTLSLITINRCDFSFSDKPYYPKIRLEWWSDGEWLEAGSCQPDRGGAKNLRDSLRTNTKGGTGSASYSKEFTFTLVPHTPMPDYKKVPLRFTLEAYVIFNGKKATPVTCSVAFPPEA